MTSITIEIRDELAEALTAEAQRRRMTIEQLAAIGVEKLLKEPDEEFEQIIQEILEDNAELYRRLA